MSEQTRPLCLLGLALAAASLAACNGEARGTTNERAPDAARRQTMAFAEAEAVEHRPVWEASGALEPARSARLAFLVGGRLVRVEVGRGDHVEEGQVLGRLDTAEVSAGIAQARAAVAAATSQLEVADDAFQRLEKLSSEGAVAEAAVVKVQHQREGAAALQAQAQAALQMAQVKGGQHVLRAPFGGTVLDAPEQVGAIVGPGIPQFEVADLTKLRARISLPAEAAGAVAVGQPAKVVTRAGGELEGRIALVLPALDPETHRLPVEVEVVPPEGEGGLANAFVRVEVQAREALPAVSVPATALVREEETKVYVVDGAVARARPVTLLATEGDRAIVQGISAGDRLVDLPPPDMRDGTRVIR